jgi:hypothetical protein
MALFDDVVETFGMGLADEAFGQPVRVVRGNQQTDAFTARRLRGRDQGQAGRDVPEVADYYAWEFAVADCKSGAAAWVPKVGDVLTADNHAGQPMRYAIASAPGEPAVELIDGEKRYRIRTQYIQ